MIDKLEIAAKNWADNDIDKVSIIKWIKDIYKLGFRRGVEKYKEMKDFTPYEVEVILVEYGQHDRRFKLGETIKYSPSDVRRILEEFDNE